MSGNQTMTAVALGMIAKDLFLEFNEVMKERIAETKA